MALTIVRLLIFLVVLPSYCHSYGNGEVMVMNDKQFETFFQIALAEKGDPYLSARNAVVDMGSSAVPLLQAKQTGAVDWQMKMVVEILLGWMNHKSEYEKCLPYAKGELPGKLRPITGKFTANQRATALAGLGPNVTHRLLEMIFKTNELTSGEEKAAVFGALSLLKDRRSVAPLLDLLQNSPDESLRRSALGTLSGIKAPQAVAPLMAILNNTSETETLRSSAALGLGLLKAFPALGALRAIFLDEINSLELRKAAVEAVKSIGDRQSTPALLQVLGKVKDLGLMLAVIDALGEIGDRSSLGPLNHLVNSHPDHHVRESAEYARDLISQRP